MTIGQEWPVAKSKLPVFSICDLAKLSHPWKMLRRSLMLVALVLFCSEARAGMLFQFVLDFGTIDVELYDVDKPVTVRNFLDYQQSGIWNRTLMHRWVTNFVIQGGSYYDDPVYGPVGITNRPAITNEYSVGHIFSNTYGTLAMARLSQNGQILTNSAQASWYFNLSDNNSFLDSQGGGYTVFGKMLRGSNVLNRFIPPAGTTNLYFYVNSQGQGTEVPVYVTNNGGRYVYVDVRPLKAKIALTPSGNAVSWTSIEGVPNVVDYSNSTNFPPVWQPISTNTGDGLPMAITNNPGSDKRGNYRVRILYP